MTLRQGAAAPPHPELRQPRWSSSRLVIGDEAFEVAVGGHALDLVGDLQEVFRQLVEMLIALRIEGRTVIQFQDHIDALHPRSFSLRGRR